MLILFTGTAFELRYCGVAGFARFCTAEYSSDVQDMDNAYMHLTNVAIQKHGAKFSGFVHCEVVDLTDGLALDWQNR